MWNSLEANKEIKLHFLFIKLDVHEFSFMANCVYVMLIFLFNSF